MRRSPKSPCPFTAEQLQAQVSITTAVMQQVFWFPNKQKCYIHSTLLVADVHLTAFHLRHLLSILSSSVVIASKNCRQAKQAVLWGKTPRWKKKKKKTAFPPIPTLQKRKHLHSWINLPHSCRCLHPRNTWMTFWKSKVGKVKKVTLFTPHLIKFILREQYAAV